MKKRDFIIFILVILSAFIVYLVAKRGNEKDSGKVKVGAILPLTGNASLIGVQIRNGLLLAAENHKDNIDLIIEDSQAEPQKAISIYKKLKSLENISIFIPTFSGVTNAISPLSISPNELLFATSVSASNITKQNSNLFRIFVNAIGDADRMAKFASDSLKLSRIAIVCVNDDFGKDYSSVFSKVFSEQNGKIAFIEFFDKSEVDFKSLVAKVKSRSDDFDAVYILAYDKNFITLLNRYKEYKINKTILSIATIGQENVVKEIDKIKSELPAIYFTNTNFNSVSNQNSDKIEFVNNYKSKFNLAPNYFAAFAYDLLNILGQSSVNTKESQRIKENILKSKFYGVMGEINFNEDRDAQFPMVIERLN
ncbi:MAG: penicillin-binding protein activator [Saprospiraceae bacterium]|nr:penicillin-binding protein activator [Candidatus Vicinibacter affinis]